MWHFATAENLNLARRSMERALMAHIYNYALFPNGEADHSRDEVFFNFVQKLSTLITIDHEELEIPKVCM